MSVIRLQDLEVYRLAEDFADQIWKICSKWDYFSRDTLGKQLVKAADSIAANFAEGFGRFHFKENKRFCFYARGSLEETRSWVRRAITRKLLSDDEIEICKEFFDVFPKKLNAYINSIGKNCQ